MYPQEDVYVKIDCGKQKTPVYIEMLPLVESATESAADKLLKMSVRWTYQTYQAAYHQFNRNFERNI